MGYYEVTCPGDQSVSVLKISSEIRDFDDKLIGYNSKCETHFNGDFIPEEEISPKIVKLYESGDPHTRSLYKKRAKRMNRQNTDYYEVNPEEDDNPQAAQAENARKANKTAA